MKVLILTTSFPSIQNPSSGIFIKKFLNYLPTKYSSVVVTPDGKNEKFMPLDRKFEVSVFRYAPKRLQILTHEPGGLPVAIKRNKFLFLMLPILLISMAVACIKNSKDADIIHSNWSLVGVVGGLISRFRSTPCLVTLRGADVNRSKTSFISKLILHLCVILNDKVVTVSEAIEHYLVSCFPDYSHKFIFIPNGVDDCLLKYKDKNINVKSGAIKVVTVGSLISRKNIITQLQALSIIKNKYNFELNIVGKGELEADLKAASIKLGLSDKVKFLGMRTQEETIEIMRSADVFILSSFAEGRPNVVLEAMAIGLPIIASDIEGVTELIKNGSTGLLFSPYDCDQLVTALEKLFTDTSRSYDLGKGAQKFIVDNKLTWTKTAEAYGQCYTSLKNIRIS